MIFIQNHIDKPSFVQQLLHAQKGAYYYKGGENMKYIILYSIHDYADNGGGESFEICEGYEEIEFKIKEIYGNYWGEKININIQFIFSVEEEIDIKKFSDLINSLSGTFKTF